LVPEVEVERRGARPENERLGNEMDGERDQFGKRNMDRDEMELNDHKSGIFDLQDSFLSRLFSST